MKLLLNLLPAICFFATYKFSDHNLIYATVAVVISSIITLGGSWLLQGKITRIQIVVILTLLVFAVPTIMVKDPDFIKWKVSVVNTVIAAVLLLCQFVFGKDIIDALTGYKTPIPSSVMKKATLALAVYFIACAFLNYVIAFRLPDIMNVSSAEAENLWVNYKTYGNGILNAVFMFITFAWVYGKLSENQKEELEKLLVDVKERHVGKVSDKAEVPVSAGGNDELNAKK